VSDKCCIGRMILGLVAEGNAAWIGGQRNRLLTFVLSSVEEERKGHGDFGEGAEKWHAGHARSPGSQSRRGRERGGRLGTIEGLRGFQQSRRLGPSHFKVKEDSTGREEDGGETNF
jgi:hypothetical protein